MPQPGKLGRQVSLVVVGDSITVASTLVAGMVLARLMAPADMGTYRQVVYLGLMATAFAEIGLSSSIYRFWNTLDEAGRRVYARMLLLSTLALGLLAAAVLGLLADHIAGWYANPGLRLALLIGAPYPLAAIPIQFLRPVLISQGASLRATALETLFALVAVLSVAVPIALGAPLNTALLVWIAACLSRVILVPIYLRQWLRGGGPWWRPAVASEVWRYLWPIQVSRVPGVLTSYLDQIVMSLYLSPMAFAVYSMGAREIPLVGMVGPSVSTVLIPHLVEDVATRRTDQICRRWRKAILTTALLTYPVASFCILYAVPVVQFLFSATYRDSSIPFRIFAAITFMRVVEYASLAKAYNRTGLILKSTFFSSGVMILLAFSLTAVSGVVGMASAVLLGYVAGASYLLAAYRELLHRPVVQFFPWPHLASIAVLALSVAAASRWVMSAIVLLGDADGLLSAAWKLGAHFLAFVVLYAAAVLVIATAVWPGVISRELRTVILDMSQRPLRP